MLDWWEEDVQPIEILCPALVGSEAQMAPFWPVGRCTFLTEQNLCELHVLDLKPIEGRLVSCHALYDDCGIHEAVMCTWKTKAAHRLIAQWEESVA